MAGGGEEEGAREDPARETTFRKAFSRARFESVEGPGLRDQASPPPGPAYEYRVVKARGRRKPARRWNRLGREGWELVAVDGGRAYFKRRTR